MNRSTGLMALFLACVTAPRPADAFVIDHHAIIYADENGSGYRLLTAAEPASGESVPLSNVTVYPESDQQEGIVISYSEDEGPWLEGKNATLILHTTFAIDP